MIARTSDIQDEQDFEYFHERDARQLTRFILRRGLQSADADDLAQEVWLKIWKHRHRFDGRDFKSWMLKIARNSIVDAIRKHKLRIKLKEEAAEILELSQKEELTGLESLLLKEQLTLLQTYLAEDNRFLEVLRAQLEGEPVAETARRFTITEKTVYSRRNRGKHLLALKLAE